MTADPARTVRVTRHIAASPERVYGAWITPETAGKWLFATDGGVMKRVDIDSRVGGKFTITETRDGQDIEHEGTYIELDRPRRLVFDFCVPQFSREPTRISVDIVPAGDGCELTLTHENVLPDYLERTTKGWTMLTERLAKVVEIR